MKIKLMFWIRNISFSYYKFCQFSSTSLPKNIQIFTTINIKNLQKPLGKYILENLNKNIITVK